MAEGDRLDQVPGRDVWVRARVILQPDMYFDGPPWEIVAFYDRDGDDFGEVFYPTPDDLQIKDEAGGG